ncbi:phage N-6-adenine-methyltransferase, partial [Loigolactobacillus coryniformis]|uniref:phage N-6-adenine-methyltransferase n=1 Tax=Loigolactobacillus coryniformis TaxID=1610 RepID=UPI00201AFF3A
CNMPYSEIKLWMEKAYRQVEKGNAKTIVCLTPARTDTIWWHNWSVKASTIVFIKGRLKFNNSKTAAPFPSCLIIFGHVSNEQKRQLSQ